MTLRAALPPLIIFLMVCQTVAAQSAAVDELFWPPRAISRPPPAPWLPIQRDGQHLRVANKDMVLGTSGLPVEISSANGPILAGPIGVSLGGSPFATASELKFFTAAGGDRTELSGTITTTVEGRSFALAMNGVIEYDGLLSFTLSTPYVPDEVRGKTFVYRIPLPASLGKFLHRPGPIGQRNIELAKFRNSSFRSSYLPFVWIGDDRQGLFWFSESRSGWGNADAGDAIQLHRDGDNWRLEISVRLQPDRNEGWQHRFGLLPTPTKTLPAQWRRWRFLPATGRTAYVVWPQESDAKFLQFGYPQSSIPAAFDRYIARLNQAGVTATPYACPTWISTSSREWQQHGEEWFTGTADDTFDPHKDWTGRFVNVCTNRRSWQQFIDTRFGEFIDRHRLRGLYMDNAQVYATRGCISNDKKAQDIEYPMLPQRDLYRGIVDRLRRNSPSTFGVVHSSGGINLPSFSSVDAWVNGEQYRDKIDRDYLQIASLTDFRVELNGAQWGLIPIFLPEFSEAARKEIAPTRKLMAILLLHDAIPWPQWANVDEINRGLTRLDRFGILDADFVPYYAEQPLAKTKNPELHISGYRRGNRSLLIAANLSARSIHSEICLPDVGSVTQTNALWTWPERKPLALRNTCATIAVGAGSYAMYLATPSVEDPQ